MRVAAGLRFVRCPPRRWRAVALASRAVWLVGTWVAREVRVRSRDHARPCVPGSPNMKITERFAGWVVGRKEKWVWR